MPQRRQETEVNKEALNALVDLYLLYKRIVAYCREHEGVDDELDIFYLRGGLQEMIKKYYSQSSLDSGEAGNNNEALTLERMLPAGVPSSISGKGWEQIKSAWGDLKPYNDFHAGYGTPTPPEIQVVLNRGTEVLERKEQQMVYRTESTHKHRVAFTSSGVGVPGEAGRHYSLRGGRKKAVLEMLERYPETLSAKAWARLVGKENPASSDSIQQVSSDVKDINKRFKINLQLDEDLILNRNGYMLNFDELDIKNSN